jgi:hypothetical protein
MTLYRCSFDLARGMEVDTNMPSITQMALGLCRNLKHLATSVSDHVRTCQHTSDIEKILAEAIRSDLWEDYGLGKEIEIYGAERDFHDLEYLTDKLRERCHAHIIRAMSALKRKPTPE